MSGFIQDFIEGFSMGFGKGKVNGKTPTPVSRNGDSLISKIRVRQPTGVKDTLLHPVNAVAYGGKELAKRGGSKIGGNIANYPGLWTLGLLAGLPAGSSIYNENDYDWTTGTNLDRMIQYGQVNPEDYGGVDRIPEAAANAEWGHPWWKPYISEGDLKHAWDWVENVNPEASKYAGRRAAFQNLVAPGITLDTRRNWESSKQRLTDVLPDSRYGNDLAHIRDAKRWYEATRLLDYLAKNGTVRDQFYVDQLGKGNSLLSGDRNALYTSMGKALNVLDASDKVVQNTEQAMLNLLKQSPAGADSQQTGSSKPIQPKPLSGIESLISKFEQ